MSARDIFIAKAQVRWDRLEALLGRANWTAPDWSEASLLYRGVCADLARAQSLSLGDDVQRYLDQLAGRAHNALYASRARTGSGLIALVFRDVPREIRTQWAFVLAAGLLFYGPMLLGAVGAFLDTNFALAVLPESQLQSMESMYSNSAPTRGAGEDATMAGFYVWNNVGIAFRCFATGFFAGLGSIFYLVYNGLVLGTVAGHLTAVGRGLNLLNFTSGHSAWELNGIVLAGAGGLRMGWALVVTEGRTRAGSLQKAGPSLYRLVIGASAMLFVAALVEGFWSAGPMPPPVKYAFGVIQCVIVVVWWLFGGRGGAGQVRP